MGRGLWRGFGGLFFLKGKELLAYVGNLGDVVIVFFFRSFVCYREG